MFCAEPYSLAPVATPNAAPAPSEQNAGDFPPSGGGVLLRQKLHLLLQQHAPVGLNTEGKLAKCLSAALHNPGSLFRAELALRCAYVHDFGARGAESLACALEYFHVASLLLDDLPIMDDSMERRGLICPHLLFGEGTTLLAALALITRAYGLLGDAISSFPLERHRLAHALIERCLGVAGIVNGQARDIGFHAGTRRGPETTQIALQKTVPLIELALVLPAVLAGASTARRRKLRRVSICWGLLYQGIDDISDVLLTVEASGKSSGRDQALGRPNVVRQIGRVRANRYLDRLEGVARACIDGLLKDDDRFEFLCSFQESLAQRRAALPAE
ncbi:MAG: polyprenyl synthetase family protein [Chthoniobacter sp.]|nr:polyprenyl synthetase family protein [Chthoniobacter sp.]